MRRRNIDNECKTNILQEESKKINLKYVDFHETSSSAVCSSLPPDTLINVFCFLRAHEVVNICSRVCLEWRVLIMASCSGYSSFCNPNANDYREQKERSNILWKMLYFYRWGVLNLSESTLSKDNMSGNSSHNERLAQSSTTTTGTCINNICIESNSNINSLSQIFAQVNWCKEFENKLKQLSYPCDLCQEKSSFQERFLERPKFIKPCKCPNGYVHVRCWDHTRRYRTEDILILKYYNQKLPFQRCTNCKTLYKLKEDPLYNGKYLSSKESIALRRMNMASVLLSLIVLLLYAFLCLLTNNGLISSIGFYLSLIVVLLIWATSLLIILEVNLRFYNDEMVKKYYLTDCVLSPEKSYSIHHNFLAL
jgi:hypothetical protein